MALMPARFPTRRSFAALILSTGLWGSLLACVPAPGSQGGPEGREPLAQQESALTATQRRSRATGILNAAVAAGLTNGLLLAGIAQGETGLAHCWSEATWACQGPGSSSCGGGPVIAGAGDGPCSIQQGGLGLFQFDAGTYAQTLAAYGQDVLTVAGNTTHAVNFVVNMVINSQYISGVSDRAGALRWMNGVRVGDSNYPIWIKTVTAYYNGCHPGACSVYDQRYQHYDDSTRTMLSELGQDFWYGNLVPPHPVVSLDRAIADVAGQARDLHPDGASAGIFDMQVGQSTKVTFDVTNASDATGVVSAAQVKISVDDGLELTHWNILDNYAHNSCGGDWCPNSADSAAGQPAHDHPGQDITLGTDAISPGETKRIVLTVTAKTPGAVADGTGSGHTNLQFFVSKIDGIYVKPAYDTPPTTNDSHFQTFNGGDLRALVQVDVWPAPDAMPPPDPTPSPDAGPPPDPTPSPDGGAPPDPTTTPDAGTPPDPTNPPSALPPTAPGPGAAGDPGPEAPSGQGAGGTTLGQHHDFVGGCSVVAAGGAASGAGTGTGALLALVMAGLVLGRRRLHPRRQGASVPSEE
jgi:MYXO-CTERM domain-containing protein